MEIQKTEKEITPSQYFDYIKGAKNIITTDELKKSYDVFIKLAEKYNKLGQVESMKKLCFLASVLLKEEKLIEMGINTFVYKDVIEDYITNVAGRTVKIIELSRYMREIPDELIETIERVKPIFDEMYVVFTDYTGKEERKIEKERREKDPILFGVFKNGECVADRFYFIGDWIDEYCDLTIDKLVEQYHEKKRTSPLTRIEKAPSSSEELIELLKRYELNKSGKNQILMPEGQPIEISSYKMNPNNKKPKSFFDKVRSIFSKE